MRGAGLSELIMAVAKERLNSIIEPAVTALGYEFVGYQLVQSGNSAVLRVYVDDENGISIDAIEKVSRQISAVLDVEEPIMGRYTLEVSSPGLDRPLFRLEDYQRFVGKPVKIRLRMPHEEGQRNFVGDLASVEGEKVTLVLASGDQIVVDFNEIDKGNLVPEF